MLTYVVRRILEGIPVLIGVTLITFFLFRVFGGDPAETYLAKHATEAQIESFRREFDLDKSLAMQYLDYWKQIVTLDFGRSFKTRREVSEVLASKIGPSLALTIPALVLTTLISLFIGMVSAFLRGTWMDKLLVISSVLGMSVSFLVYIVVLQYLLAYELGWFPVSFHLAPDGAAWYEMIRFYALPVMISVIVATGYDVRFYRAVMLEEIGRDYITTGIAKGLSKKRILFVHMLRNAMIPIITRIMISLPFLITGSLLLERFFGIPGMGDAILQALDTSDYPMIKAITLIISFLFVGTNILTDVLYAWADPRVKLS